MVFPDSNPPQPRSAAVKVLQTLYGQLSQAGLISAVLDNHHSSVSLGLNSKDNPS
jgi:hypothetical protein